MIASLSGPVVAIEPGSVVIDVSGVGFHVLVSPLTSNSQTLNQSVTLFTSFVIREDSFTLFGFASISEQKVFDLLRSVSGVGPKSALAILGELSVEQIIDAVSEEKDQAFRAVSGIGPKTAKLIILTLVGKLGGNSGMGSKLAQTDLSAVVSALTGLGWNEKTAVEAANRASALLGSSASNNSLLKAALSNLGASKLIGASDE